MVYCNDCKDKVPSDAVYCPRCGKKILPVVTNTPEQVVKGATESLFTGYRWGILGLCLIVAIGTYQAFINSEASKQKAIKQTEVVAPVTQVEVASQIKNNQTQASDNSTNDVKVKAIGELRKNNIEISADSFSDCLVDENYRMALLLLQSGLSPNARTQDGTPIIFIAVASNNSEIIRNLINVGADVNLKGPEGYTPLMMAAFSGNYNVVSVLVGTRGININAQDSDGMTALQRAKKTKAGWDKLGMNTSGQVEAIKILVSAGAK